ncbi:hypothetical protein [Desulfuromonas sp.]|uniref:hypothetical protein n=1 Tax=Desulfuromonas sp. TaxID=892 RepID=UPI0025C5E2E0|nr:hypothetical protein [Desulfuromonas sp.]
MFPTLLRTFKCLALPVFLLFLSGCAPQIFTDPLPPGVTVRSFGPSAPGSPLAWDPSGQRLALASGGLGVRDLQGGDTPLSSGRPRALTWSPSGDKLAAGFDAPGGRSLLRVYAMAGGIVGETSLEGRVGGLHWSPDGTVVAACQATTPFSFGTGLKVILYLWDGAGAPKGRTLRESVVRPATLSRSGEKGLPDLHLRLSPWGDEILYTRLYDPPNLQASLQLVLARLNSPEERILAQVATSSGGGLFSRDGESVLYGDGVASTLLHNPWEGGELVLFDRPGRRLALSPSQRYALVDGTLYRDGTEIAALAEGVQGFFAPSGERLLLRRNGRLFLAEGLEGAGDAGSFRPAESLRTLRDWRSRGLISHEEYLERKERMQTP